MNTNARNLRAILIVAVAVVLCALVLAHQRLNSSRDDLSAARHAHHETLTRAGQVLQLREQTEFVADRPRPEPDLVARLGSHLARVGARASAFTGVSMRSAAIRGEEGLVRQTAEVRLSTLEAGRLARFLESWKANEPLWTVAAVRMQHNGRNSTAATAESFDVRLTLESVHWKTEATADEGAPT